MGQHWNFSYGLPRLNVKHRQIPGDAEWSGYQDDFEVRHAHKLMFGKSTAEVQQYFGGTASIQRADELLFMPRKAFQYYVQAFAEFVRSDAAIGDADSASPFLHLLINREERDKGSVAEVYADLRPTVDYVAANQSRFDAQPDIYGDFGELADLVRARCQP